jgi:UDP-2-acetamido-3-amino-2,3-dideoxy-glucuronate N-acetyltransferase
VNSARIHPTAIIEDGVEIGEGSAIWDSVHIRGPGTSIGSSVIIGEKTYIAYDVRIGNRVKVNAFAYICAGVTIEDGVMVSAGTIFTNDRFPRAATTDLSDLLTSEEPPNMPRTTVAAGATIGAGAIVGPGVAIGRFAMIGMGTVMTRSVGDHMLVIGNPGRVAGLVCACGSPWTKELPVQAQRGACLNCGLTLEWSEGTCRVVGA